MKNFWKQLFGEKIAGTRVIPVRTKILFIFTLIILASNLTSNYINLILHRTELLRQMRELLVKDLRDIYSFANNQYEIYGFTKDRQGSLESIERKGLSALKNPHAIVLGVRKDGRILFMASRIPKKINFGDKQALKKMKENLKKGVQEGFIPLQFNSQDYFAVYKYNPKWKVFLIRGEEKNEYYQKQRVIFRKVSIIIVIITIASALVGIYLLGELLKWVGIITRRIMRMAETQELEIIDLKGAPNDDITFLGAAFNSLSSTVNNLIGIFRKFANQDIVRKAYKERQVRLEGEQKELAVLFSDIKRFTTMTEALGPDIIRLLNLHYDKAIRVILNRKGVIGAIIGDALLAVYGVLDEEENETINRSYQAIYSGYELQEGAAALREEMKKRRDAILAHRKLTPEETKVYKAVMLEIGVGIDYGSVFYGTLGSYQRMTNTVIGDNVNAASRLEGLTRIYQLPVIVSKAVKEDVEKNMVNHGIHFVEIDRVKVKGKTQGTQIYWPVLPDHLTPRLKKQISIFETALRYYYKGEWKKANDLFKDCKLKMAREFEARTASKKPPAKWNGIWEMKTK
ncbi:MAG: adenylate/guanylate cyclase domain-containing protein [Candidatus Hydrogenedentota bacterium]|nr:MAG: adenylate/guanylate cyclase domain-containing protein [Candidatus Hydrogenedentota bacterium]